MSSVMKHCRTCTCELTARDVPKKPGCVACEHRFVSAWDVHGWADKVRRGELRSADVARDLGITRQAIEIAFKKHSEKSAVKEGSQARKARKQEERRLERADRPRSYRRRALEKFPDEYLIQSMQAMHKFLKLGDQPMSHSLYSKMRPPHLPSAPCIMDRFDTWNAACEIAGLPRNEPIRDNYTRISRKKAVDDVRRFVIAYREVNGRYAPVSAAKYELWAKDKENNAVSRATIAKKFGWTSVINEVLEDLYGGRDASTTGS